MPASTRMIQTRIQGNLGGWSTSTFGTTVIDVWRIPEIDLHLSVTPWCAPVLAPAVQTIEEKVDVSETSTAPFRTAFCAGWPLRCLWAHGNCIPNRSKQAIAPSDPGFAIGKYCYPSRRAALVFAPRFIAMRPLWIGMVGNTLFYAGLWAALVPLTRWAIHARRRRSGRCAGCGYDLRGGHERCPECGTLVE